MLSKLFRYDMKALFRMMLPLTLSVLGTTLAGTAAVRILVEMSKNSHRMDNPFTGLFMASMGMLVFAAVMALVAYAVIAAVFIFYRYYKNLFTDEGYLTFTLPVSPGQILFSKSAAGILWSLISFVVIVFCSVVMILVGGGVDLGDVVDAITEIFRSLWGYMGLDSVLLAIESILGMLLSLVSSLLLCYLSITLGSTVVRRHKVMASIGIYLGIRFGLSIVSSMIQLLPSIYMASTAVGMDNTNWMLHLTFGINLLISAGVAVGSYLISRSILTRRLNLT